MKTKIEMRLKRKLSIRRKIRGTEDRLRMAIYRSNARMSVQFINDDTASTVLSVSENGKNVAAAQKLGTKAAELAKAKKITTVVFDRAGYRYHGAVKALAEAARAGGLVF